MLDVITCISNPVGYKSRISLYKIFEKHMLDSGVRLTTVECAYGEREFELPDHQNGIKHIKVRASNVIWNKENLLNIALGNLKHDWKYVAWIDADVIFRNPNWVSATKHALQIYDIVQPWADCYDLGPNGEHIAAHESFAKIFHQDRPIYAGKKDPYAYPHTGYAWAATRRAINLLGGLLEMAVSGSGDHHMAFSLLGRANETLPHGLHQNYRDQILIWQERAVVHIGQNIGFVPGTIEHLWHGPKAKRGYMSRWDILTQNELDPLRDVKKNSFGVLELTCNKPKLRQDILKYFHSRDEDSNSLS